MLKDSKIMNHFISMFRLILVLFYLFLASCSVKENRGKKIIRIGSASSGSSGYVHFEACAYLVNKYSDKVIASSMATSGSVENVVLLDQGKVDIGSASTLDVEAAWSGQINAKKRIPVLQVFSWTVWAIPLVVLEDSTVTSYPDLIGKKINIVKKGSGAEHLHRLILEEYGILQGVKVNYMPWQSGVDALIDGTIAATPGNFTAGNPSPLMLNLASRKKYRALAVKHEVMQRVINRNKGAISITLPRASYEGLNNEIQVPGFTGIAISMESVADDLVYEFTKAVLEHIDELHNISKVSETSTLENAVKWLMPEYPVHPGAVRFYKEKGVWRNELKEWNP